jgi:hypothetical protein
VGEGGEGGQLTVSRGARGGSGITARQTLAERFPAQVLLVLAIGMEILLVALLLTPINR